MRSTLQLPQGMFILDTEAEQETNAAQCVRAAIHLIGQARLYRPRDGSENLAQLRNSMDVIARVLDSSATSRRTRAPVATRRRRIGDVYALYTNAVYTELQDVKDRLALPMEELSDVDRAMALEVFDRIQRRVAELFALEAESDEAGSTSDAE